MFGFHSVLFEDNDLWTGGGGVKSFTKSNLILLAIDFPVTANFPFVAYVWPKGVSVPFLTPYNQHLFMNTMAHTVDLHSVC